MTSLREASSIRWPAAPSPCSPTSEPFELELWEVLQAALGAATTAVTSTVFTRKRARATVEPPAEKVQQQEEAPSPLDDAAGVEQLLGAGFEQVFGKHALSVPGSLFPRDHLFRALVSAGLIKDERVFFKSEGSSTASSTASLSSLTSDSSSAGTTTTPVPLAVLVGAYALGDNGCGHAGITHGGLTAALFDESVGELLYIAKMKGLMKFKFVVTASLEVSYKKPWQPSAQPAYVTAYISEVQGRKIWVEAVIADTPLTGEPGAPLPEGCSVYATAKALFLEPRPEGSSSAALQKAAEGRPDQLGANGGAGKV